MNRSDQPSAPPADPMSLRAIIAIGVFLFLSFALQVTMLVALWPNALPNGRWEEAVRIFGSATIPADRRLLVLVLFAGGIGSMVHALSSFMARVGARTISSSWTWWYLLRPTEGAVLALVFYLVLRGGLLASGDEESSSEVSVYGVTAIAVLVGMFSQQAVAKLKSVAETLFTKPDVPSKDAQGNAATRPTVLALTPAEKNQDTTDFSVAVSGTGFTVKSKGRIDGEDRDTEYKSENELRIQITRDDLNVIGTKKVTVHDPASGNGESNPVNLTITS